MSLITTLGKRFLEKLIKEILGYCTGKTPFPSPGFTTTDRSTNLLIVFLPEKRHRVNLKTFVFQENFLTLMDY